ncbi:MAG: DUF2723 domain-containing protein [Verrucomicrobia bacterium]|nr:DUF2723 domain-containing protein [Verrucomicrobiota bacterium]MCH8526621.1 DUF2723 domain-containing protein [Kiritimatiellia bacterium]
MKKIFSRLPPAAGVGVTAFILYFFTGSRTIQWQDSGQFTLRIGLGLLENDWGLALVHPLHFLLGQLAVRIFPGNIPWAVTGVSALAGAVTVGLVYACVRLATDNRRAALYAAFSLMLAHTFWRFSGLPEVYTLSAALLMLQVYGLLKLRTDPDAWLLIGLANGLSWANHNLALLELAVLGTFFLLQLQRKQVTPALGIRAAGLWLSGSLPYTALILRTMLREQRVLPVIYSALFGHSFSDAVLATTPVWIYTATTLAFVLLSFPLLPLIFAVLGIRSRARQTAPILALFLIHSLFVLRYNVIDQYTFYIPAMALIAFFAGLGYDRLARPLVRRAAVTLLLLQPLLYAAAPALIRNTGLLRPFERHKPHRDDADYLFHPWTVTETSAARLAAEAVAAAAPDGTIVVEDSMALYAVQWKQHINNLPGITLLRPADFEAFLEATLSDRPVIWIPASTLQDPPQGWKPRGAVWILDLAPE